jgi:hypothetical protein
MATRLKILGQALPAANTFTDIYRVPVGNSAVVSTLNICNLTASNVSFRIAARPNANTLTAQQYLAYDVALPAQDTIALTIGMSLAANDTITAFSFQGNVAFTLFGSEVF